MSAVATQAEAPQADFLGAFDAEAKIRDEALELKLHRESWMCCWRWKGPEVGGFIEVHTPIVKRKVPLKCEGTEWSDGPFTEKTVYAYMEQARVLTIEGRTVTAVLEGNNYPQNKDGTEIILDLLDIWAPTRFLNLQEP